MKNRNLALLVRFINTAIWPILAMLNTRSIEIKQNQNCILFKTYGRGIPEEFVNLCGMFDIKLILIDSNRGEYDTEYQYTVFDAPDDDALTNWIQRWEISYPYRPES